MPTSTLRTLLRDPLLHFTLLGGLLFGAHYLLRDDPAAAGNDIVITENRIAHLSAIFERRWQRPPQPAELQGLIDDFVREEVLYREAVRQGLDRDDTVIRRRLRMKMELLAKDLVDAVEPGDTTLQNYYREHSERYQQPALYSFEQIYLDSDKRAEAAEDARVVLTRLTAGADPRELGDNSLLKPEYREISAAQAERVFGGSFAAQLRELQPDQWHGPITSAYGEHLVKIFGYQPQRSPEFTEVRPQLLRDWQQEEKSNILETQYQTLRANYRISMPATPTDSVPQEQTP